jgi:hypothetical protein
MKSPARRHDEHRSDLMQWLDRLKLRWRLRQSTPARSVLGWWDGREQHRQAVGHLDGEHDPGLPRHGSIGAGRRGGIRFGRSVHLVDLVAMHLFEPAGLGG